MTSFSMRQQQAANGFSALPYPTFTYGLDIRSTLALPVETHMRASSIPQEPLLHPLPDGAIFCDLPTAMHTHSHIIEPYLGSLLSSQNKFEAFHLSMIKNGFFLYLPPHVQVKEPILIPSLPDAVSHLFIYASPHSSATIFHPENDDGQKSFRSSAVEMVAEEGARIHYSSLQDFSGVDHRFSFKRARIGKDASVDWHWAEFGSAFTKLDVISFLEGANASTQNIGVFVEKGSQSMDIDARAYHRAPHTHSHLLARGVLDDYPKNVYKGLLNMRPEARGAVGNQRVDVLLLSPHAEADPVPALEIEGSDVRCSHAATVGRLDKERLFYLASRGLDEDAARALYIRGFLEHILSQFPHTFFHADCQHIIDSRLHLHHPAPISPEVVA
ncbi:MAG: SufD family Fe-S cluster assembly protein [archaeon]|nr:SufD family Fe-S cluster assembly protein [archaeon]